VPAFADEVAPTEDVAYRGGTVRGLVHDDNAFAFAGDASCGHAGAFGTADDVLALGEALLDTLGGRRDGWLDAGLLAALLAPWPGGSHVFGFDTRGGPAPSSGARFGPRTFGHLGFTGTSIWIDPDQELVGVLLTNRVHPSRDHVAIRAARPVVYDAIADAAGQTDPDALATPR
jgi:CubicO group peptidase (beta-lactamase class C family)